jgi:inosose dehydratase
MSVRIGINPLTWSNDDLPEMGGDTPLEICLSEARASGYAGVELGNKFPRQAAELRPILDRHGLRLVSGWYSARLLERSVDEEMQAIEAHATLLSALGCDVLVFAEVSRCVHGARHVPLSRRPEMEARDWRRFTRAISEVGRRLRGRGLQLAYHHHMGTVVQSQADIDCLMAGTGAEVGLLLDTGHLTYAGGDPAACARDHAARIVHVHCKDVRAAVLEHAQASDSSFLNAVLDGVFTVPGDGCVDYAAVLSSVRSSGYHGWLVVEAEQDPALAHPATYAGLGYRNLLSLAHGAGFAVAAD